MSSLTFEELDLSELQELLAGSRQRGQYDEVLNTFVEQGIPGAPIPLDAGIFAGKKPNSVKTGFESAIREMDKRNIVTEENREAAKNVKVVVKNDRVFLVRRDLVGAGSAA